MSLEVRRLLEIQLKPSERVVSVTSYMGVFIVVTDRGTVYEIRRVGS